jgi:hypothetical protein
MGAINDYKLTNMVPVPAGTATVRILIPGEDGALLAYGTSVPSAVAGYAKGCIFIDVSGAKTYSNTGTSSSCTFTSYI